MIWYVLVWAVCMTIFGIVCYVGWGNALRLADEALELSREWERLADEPL